MQLQNIAIKAGLPASTALRLINTLLNNGYATQDPMTLRYSLSLKFSYIGSLVSSQVRIRDLAHPYLMDLSRKCQESVCLAIEQDMEVIYIDVIDGPDGMLQITQRIGKRAPMHSTGVGKILLENYSSKQLNQLIAIKGLQILTPHTISNRENLVSEIDAVKKQGYALDNEECELGARCVAVGIRDYSKCVVAGISISGPISRMSMEKISTIIHVLSEGATNISRLLGYEEAGTPV